MENRPNLHETLFSRNSTPPTQPLPDQHLFSPHMGANSSPNLIGTLFQNLPAAPDQPSILNKGGDVHPMDKYDTAPGAPNAPLLSDSAMSSQSGSNSTHSATEKQNALLSMLNQPATGRSQSLAQPPQAQPQQIPTPPGTRSNASPQQGTDPQKLFDQIMVGGTSSRSTNYSDTQRSNAQAPSPPHSQRDEYQSFPLDHPIEASPRTRATQQVPMAPPFQPQPPSPRRSIFEYTTAFDHLTATNTKKKTAPVQPTSAPNPAEDAWNTAIDPKRQSVENLLVNLTRDQPQPVMAQPPAYEPYDFQQHEPVQSGTRAPLPPIPSNQKPGGIQILPNVTGSPRSGSPKPLHRPQAINNNQQMPYSGTSNRRDKENSPARGKPGSQRVHGKFSKPPTSPGLQSQSIVFDVSQPLEEIQARDSVKSTAIALVRQDSIFLPGTTIGATHWVAYAMTRGRVRVISRSSGDRTLLQLPQVFASISSVIDMAVYGNRLAGVTSDGGFVVWELPEVIMDDVPGRILLCVPPTNDRDAIRAVKWHPKDPDTLAIASDNKVFLVDLANTHALHVQPLPHSDLHHIGQVFNVPAPIVAFDFDVANDSLATISEDSSLTIWNTQDSLPNASHKIYGEDVPSSLTFVDGGIIVGRKNGTIFQLLSVSRKDILSTIKFVSSAEEYPDMFGHVNYDSRIQTLWVANSRRESLIALKLRIEPPYIAGEDTRGFIEQVAEYSGIKPTIHFVILTADSDPHGDEAHAACVAAKIPPGELALVAFSVHSSGVDQVLIRKEWYDHGLAHAESKFPLDVPLMQPTLPSNVGSSVAEHKAQRNPLPVPPTAAPQPQQAFPPSFVTSVGSVRGRTPPSEDVENDLSSDHKGSRSGGAHKGKNINWKEKEESLRDKEKGAKPSDSTIINDSTLGQALSREIKKTEDSLHTKIGRLIGKEMDKQHQRFEETRMHEQAEEFARQEKILKLISSELTRNTTRVVEQAVKAEVQQSVLPSLENITRAEVKAVLNDQVNNGLIEVINRGLPGEIEKILLRPNVSNHYASLLTQALMPVIERQIKETLNSSFLQFHSQHSTNLQQEIMRELRKELLTIKSDLGNWHNEALRSQETTIRDLERTVRSLSEQVKFLTINAPASALLQLQTQPTQNSSTGAAAPPLQTTVGTSHLRQVPTTNSQPSYGQALQNFQQAPPPQTTLHPQWYQSIAAPQASHPTTIPQPSAAAQEEKTPPPKVEEWDAVYLDVLTSQDPVRLRSLLARTNPDVVVPLSGPPPVSQAVILTLVHRLSGIISETSPNDDFFKTMLWWLQRVVNLVRPDDKLIADFIPRVVPTVQQSLNTTKQRLNILPGGSGTIEAVRQLTEVQEVLRRKVSV